jgi:2-desacetyl-2-hydroxyethyl bacteriochlorophyllide A dehydrogenase
MTTKTTTRAFQLTAFGLENFKQSDIQLGELGPHDVLVRMRAASLNYRDWLVAKGLYSPNMKLPLVPLSDGAGEVVEVGKSVSRFKPGDRVTPIFMQGWISGVLTKAGATSALGGAIDGVLQNEAIFSEEGLVHIPQHLSFEEAATLPCAAVTAWNALFEQGDVQPGSTVLALGTGGVSIFTLQLAHAAGARVIITSSSNEKLERAKKMGADICINYKDNQDWDKAVLQAVPDGVDHIVEVGGAGTLERSMKAIRIHGHISLIGLLAKPAPFDVTKLLMKGVRLQGIYVGSREMFERMNKAIEQNKIKPVIDKTFKVEQIKEALETMESGSHFGKIVLRF